MGEQQILRRDSEKIKESSCEKEKENKEIKLFSFGHVFG